MMLMIVLAAALIQTSGTPFRTLDKGSQSLVESGRQAAARNAGEWSALWKEHAGDARPQPAVDFSREIVVGVFLGSRPTAGFAVEVTAVAPGESGALIVRYREARPRPGAITAQVLTAPFHLVAVPVASGPPPSVTFERVN